MSHRLRGRITRGEMVALALAVGAAGAFFWQQSAGQYFAHYDLDNYLAAARGDYTHYYYGYWLVPVFTLLSRLPSSLAYALWSLLAVGGVFFASRVFRGHTTWALASYQMLYALFQGQIVGLALGALALFWWGIMHRRWTIAGLALAVAAGKYQVGGIVGIAMLLSAQISWKERWRVLVWPAAVVLLSFVVYPGWPLQALETLRSSPPDDQGSIALWRWIGPAVLLLWLPPLVLPMTRPQRLLALVATNALALPYFQQTDLLFLFVLPVGYLPLFGNLGYLNVLVGWAAIHCLVVLPLVVYLVTVLPGVSQVTRHIVMRYRDTYGTAR